MREIRTLRCDVEGTGNVAWSRYCDTRRRKSELTVNTNFDLNRRASPRPYLREAGGEIPPAYSPRRLQRDEKSRLRVRTQFRPWPALSGDDAGEPEPPRLRLAHCARIAGAALDRCTRGRGEANQLLRPSGHDHRLRGLSLLDRLPRSPHHLRHPARADENPKNRMTPDNRTKCLLLELLGDRLPGF